MKLLLAMFVMAGVISCGFGGDRSSQSKFAIRKKVEVKEYFHAKYKFTHADYEDVYVAVRVETENGSPISLQVKDLSSEAEDAELEEAVLTSNISGDFVGTSAGAVGGRYTGRLETSNGVVTGCCGFMTFEPTATEAPDLIFLGEKIEVLGGEEWDELVDDEQELEVEPEPDETVRPAEMEEESSIKKFYSFHSSSILVSRNEFSLDNNPYIKYVVQNVIGVDGKGEYLPPQVHIKRVNDDGTIDGECLSLLYSEKLRHDPSPDNFYFNYRIWNGSVDFIYGYNSLYEDDENTPRFNVGAQFPTGPGSSTSYSALGASLTENGDSPVLVPEAEVVAKNSEWGITDDIVEAFSTNSNCDPLGHNRKCIGCILQ